MCQLSLNEDVLFAIVSVLSAEDALRLAQTSRHTRLIALPRGLSTVTLKTPHQLIAFAAYILHAAPGHAVFLRRLDVLLNEVHSRATSFLADILDRAQTLTSICIFNVGLLMKAAPRIGHAIAALERLEHVQLREVRTGVEQMVSRFRSRPRKVELSASMKWDQPLLHLSQLSALQDATVIRLSNITLRDDVASGPSLQAGLQLRAVQHLTLIYVEMPKAVLANAFPHLKSVHIRGFFLISPSSAISQSPVAAGRPIDCLTLDVSRSIASTLEIGSLDLVRDALQCLAPAVLSVVAPINSHTRFWAHLAELARRVPYLVIDSEMDATDARTDARADIDGMWHAPAEWIATVPPLLAPLSAVCIRASITNTHENHDTPLRDDWCDTCRRCAPLRCAL